MAADTTTAGPPTAPDPDRDPDARDRAAVAALPLEERVALLTGADTWSTRPCPALGLTPIVFSDGPAGVRGAALDERRPSSAFPCPVAVAATWDEDLVQALGAAMADEARSRGVSVLLAPTINLIRTPLGGRAFECYSEDPQLTGRIAAAFVRGAQSRGVAVAVKHFVGNDAETDRWTVDAHIPETVLREVYLAPFEVCVRDADAALVMAAYNRVNGVRMTEHTALVHGILKQEWGFRGVVISDWHAARGTIESALGGLDLSMPGPRGPWGPRLTEAVHTGAVPETEITDKVLRLLRLARRVGAAGEASGADGTSETVLPLAGAARDATSSSPWSRTDGMSGTGPHPSGDGSTATAALEPDATSEALPSAIDKLSEVRLAAPLWARTTSDVPSAPAHPHHLADPALLRRAAAAAMTLLRNENAALPLALPTRAADANPAAVRSIALIGPGARTPCVQGGGSVRVAPARVVTPAAGLADALGTEIASGSVRLSVAEGCRTWLTVPAPSLGQLTDPVTGEPGVRLEFHDGDGRLTRSERRLSTDLVWPGDMPRDLEADRGTMTLRCCLHPERGGRHSVGVAGVGVLRLLLDGVEVLRGTTRIPTDPVEAMVRPEELRADVDLTGRQTVDVLLEFEPRADENGPVALRLGIAPDDGDDDARLAEAERLASHADVAVVVVGSPDGAEAEGFDRPDLRLPGRQDELVRRVAAANPRTIAVVNAGAPMLLPWADDVAAVLWTWLPGQEMGGALADVLLGVAEPTGRLPVTLPRAAEDCPVLHATPVDSRLHYDDGLLVGYRGYDRRGTAPHFPFGHGLGYTTWAYETLDAEPAVSAGRGFTVRVRLRNTGHRAGREVVQVYVGRPADPPHRPLRLLAAFATVHAAPGEPAEATVPVPPRALARWDEATHAWTWPSGEFTVTVGRSSGDLRLTTAVTVT